MGKGRDMDLEIRIKTILNELNINIKNKGYRCWVEAVKIAIENRHKTCPMTTKLYPETAKRLGDEIHRVERAMRHAYENNKEEVQKYFNVKYKIDNSTLLALIVDKLEREGAYGCRKSDGTTTNRI